MAQTVGIAKICTVSSNEVGSLPLMEHIFWNGCGAPTAMRAQSYFLSVSQEEYIMNTRDYVVHRISVIIMELEQLKQLQDNAYTGLEETEQWHDQLNKAIDALYDAQ